MSDDSGQPEPEDERGYWTITLDGGPATTANLATTLRTMSQRSWTGRVPSMHGFVERLAAALDQAQFTPVRNIEIRRRDPEEARARILASDLPADLKAALAVGIGPLPPLPPEPPTVPAPPLREWRFRTG